MFWKHNWKRPKPSKAGSSCSRPHRGNKRTPTDLESARTSVARSRKTRRKGSQDSQDLGARRATPERHVARSRCARARCVVPKRRGARVSRHDSHRRPDGILETRRRLERTARGAESPSPLVIVRQASGRRSKLSTPSTKRASNDTRKRRSWAYILATVPNNPNALHAVCESFQTCSSIRRLAFPEFGRQPPPPCVLFSRSSRTASCSARTWALVPLTSRCTFGSRGKKKATDADRRLFFDATRKYFETSATNMKHPTPIQGDWRINGIELPAAILEKLYSGNAKRVLNLA